MASRSNPFGSALQNTRVAICAWRTMAIKELHWTKTENIAPGADASTRTDGLAWMINAATGNVDSDPKRTCPVMRLIRSWVKSTEKRDRSGQEKGHAKMRVVGIDSVD